MKKASNSLVCLAGHTGSGPFCFAVSVPLQTSIFLVALDSSWGQPQWLRETDRRQNFDCWGPDIAINKVLPTEILLETSLDSKLFWEKKIRTLADGNWKASICLIHRLLLFFIFLRTVWQLIIIVQTGCDFTVKKNLYMISSEAGLNEVIYCW